MIRLCFALSLLLTAAAAQRPDGTMPGRMPPDSPAGTARGSTPTADSGTVCKTVNGQATTNTATRWIGNNWFWHECRAGSRPLDVTGFRFLCRDAQAPRTIQTGIFAAVGDPPTRFVQLAGGTMNVGTTSAYNATRTTPVVRIAPGSTFFVAIRTPPTNTFQQQAATGSITCYYWGHCNPCRRWCWRPFAWQVECAAPTRARYTLYGSGCRGAALRVRGVPALGASFAVDVGQVWGNAASTLFVGASRTAWGQLALPFDLTPLGAPGCRVLASGEAQLAGLTTPRGTRSVTLRVPNVPALKGGRFFNQFFVANRFANPLGIVATNGGEALVGDAR